MLNWSALSQFSGNGPPKRQKANDDSGPPSFHVFTGTSHNQAVGEKKRKLYGIEREPKHQFTGKEKLEIKLVQFQILILRRHWDLIG